jgi:hypothetical protein
MPRLRSALVAPGAALLALSVLVAPAGAALAAPAEGSVPSEVRTYVTDGSLVQQLDDVYGPGSAGEGLDFDDTTKPGVIERVHVWSAALREGEETDRYVELLNEWVVPISIADEPVGLATIWINPASVAPELASFVRDADLAAALSEVAAGSSLVHDAASGAWLALAADGTLTPLVPGSTGLSTPVPIDDVAILPAGGDTPPPTGDPNTGVGLAIAVLLLLLAIIVVALVVPTVRAKKADAAAAAAEVEPVEDAGAAPAIEAAPTKKSAKKSTTTAAPEPEE